MRDIAIVTVAVLLLSIQLFLLHEENERITSEIHSLRGYTCATGTDRH